MSKTRFAIPMILICSGIGTAVTGIIVGKAPPHVTSQTRQVAR